MSKERVRTVGVFGLLVLLMFGIPAELAAQTRGSVKGHLMDTQSGEPLMFANVALKGTTTGTVTDTEGNYQINNLKPGTYTPGSTHLNSKDF